MAASSLSAGTAPGITVIFFGVAPVTGMIMMPGVPVRLSALASASFFSSADVKLFLPASRQPAFAAARSISSFVSFPSLLPVV